MLLPVPLIRQPNSYTCLAACVKALLAFVLPKSPSLKTIAREIGTDRDGALLESAARYLAWEHGLKTTLVMFDSCIHPRWYKQVSANSRMRDIRKRIKVKKLPSPVRKRYTTFLELNSAGGMWIARPISVATLKAIVGRGTPVIVTLEENVISLSRDNATKPLNHAVIVIGVYKGGVYILDSADGVRWHVPDRRFTAAWYKMGGEALYVRKKGLS